MSSKTRKKSSKTSSKSSYSISPTNSEKSTSLSYQMPLVSEFFQGRTTRIQNASELYNPDPSIFPPFWLQFFNQSDLYTLKQIVIELLTRKVANITIQRLIPGEELTINNPYYIAHIHTVLILIGIFSYKFNDAYTFLIKGGKAIQLALHSSGQTYKSNDIDLLIIKHTPSVLQPSAEQMAKEFAKLIIWLTSIYEAKSLLSILEIQDIENIVKISLNNQSRFIPLMDIGYKEGYAIDSHILPFFREKYNRKQLFKIPNIFPGLTTPNVKCVFISENIDGLIYERLYFLVKIFIGKIQHLSDVPTIMYKNNMFLEKIYKSLIVLIRFKMIKGSSGTASAASVGITRKNYISTIRRYLNKLIIGEISRKEDIIDAIIYDIITDKHFNE